MPQLFDVTFGPQHVALANIGSDGSIPLVADNSFVLAATVPLTTGLLPLDALTLSAVIYLSCDIVTVDGLHLAQYRNVPFETVQGNPVPANVSAGGFITAQPGLTAVYDSPSSYVSIDTRIISSGDYELRFRGLTAGALNSKVSNLSVSYRVLGCK